jgi:signal peptidase II
MTDPTAPEVEPPVAAPPEVASPEAVPAAAELGPRRLGLIASIAITVLVLDQATKHWALNALSDGRVIEVVGSLQFNLRFNTGMAFSLGSDSGIGPWVTVLAIFVVVAVSLGATSRIPLGAVASGLITGGAIGNLIDRAFRGDDGFLHGAVVDFIDLQWWPVFNIADAAIVVGAILLVLASFRAAPS